jgi:hypothetical protein
MSAEVANYKAPYYVFFHLAVTSSLFGQKLSSAPYTGTSSIGL